MIDNKKINTARENWLQASEKLNFRIITPYRIKINNHEKVLFAFLEDYGSSNGMFISIISPPDFEIDKNVVEWANQHNCYYSFINIERCMHYDELFFQESLNDWGRFR